MLSSNIQGSLDYYNHKRILASERCENNIHISKMSRHYRTFNYSEALPGSKTFLTGIRAVKKSKEVYISGVYTPPNSVVPTGLIYKGYLAKEKGTWYTLNYPSSAGVTVTGTSLYGPNNGHSSKTVQTVGNYTTQETGSATLGCLYEGPLDGSGTWTTLLPTSAKPVLNTIAHSVMGGLVVGNYDTQLDEGKAFLYDIKTKKYYDITHPDTKSITCYGIWKNCDDSYTICGGYADINLAPGFTYGYIAHWNNKKKSLSKFYNYVYANDPAISVSTDFDGITSDGKGGYNLTGDWVDTSGNFSAFFAHVKKVGKPAYWEHIAYPDQKVTSGNSVYRNVIIGIYTSPGGDVSGYISY